MIAAAPAELALRRAGEGACPYMVYGLNSTLSHCRPPVETRLAASETGQAPSLPLRIGKERVEPARPIALRPWRLFFAMLAVKSFSPQRAQRTRQARRDGLIPVTVLGNAQLVRSANCEVPTAKCQLPLILNLCSFNSCTLRFRAELAGDEAWWSDHSRCGLAFQGTGRPL